MIFLIHIITIIIMYYMSNVHLILMISHFEREEGEKNVMFLSFGWLLLEKIAHFC